MGQYHYTVNLDKKEFIHPHKLGDGLKLGEQVAGRGGVPAALFILLACSNGRGGGDFGEDPIVGRWAGDRVAVVGDYGEDGDLAPEHKAGEIYEQCAEGKGYEDISELLLPILERECDVEFKKGEGWRDRIDKSTGNPERHIRPDMIITCAPQE